MAVPKNRGKCKSATVSLHRGDSLSASGPPGIWRDHSVRLHTLSILCDSPRDNQYVTGVHVGKATHAQRNYLVGLATKKSRGTITHLHP